MKKVIIIGATSGIGRELAGVFSEDGYIVGITGRRLKRLEQLKEKLPNLCFIKQMDVSSQGAVSDLKKLIIEINGVDIIVISAGVASIDTDLPWEKEAETIDTNVRGFAAMANVAYHYFLQKGSGHIVGISSIAAIRGGGFPAYNASKAFVSNYLQSLQYITEKNNSNMVITDIQPGFVDTKMAKGEGLFWVSSLNKAANQIYNVINKKKKHAYITKRWRLIAWLLKIIPDGVYNRL